MKQRLNITLMDDAVLDVKRLRTIMEHETHDRISIAAVIKKLVKEALEARNHNTASR